MTTMMMTSLYHLLGGITKVIGHEHHIFSNTGR